MKRILRGTIVVALLTIGLGISSVCNAQTDAGRQNATSFSTRNGRPLFSIPASKTPAAGQIQGFTRTAVGLAVLPNAQIILHSTSDNSDRTIVSGADGAFNIDGVLPGYYELTASKRGFANSSVVGIDLPAGQTLHLDMTVGAALPAGADSGTTDSEKYLLSEVESLKVRLSELEARMADKPAVNAATEASKAAVAPAQTAQGDAAAVPADAAQSARGTQVALATPLASGDATLSTSTPADQPKPPKAEPFAFGDFTWLNGNARTKDTPLDTKLFTPEIRADVSYIYDYNHPQDHTIGGSSEVFRSGEFQLTDLGVGGDFHFDNVIARVMTQFGMYSVTTPRNDASPAVGQWDLADAYRYVSEAYGGYHFNVMHGINVEAGIFMSYIGLFSYYNFDNWAYQPSYVSSNTPWFFNGMRVQIFPTEHLKIEPWIINGWQSYGKFNHRPGFGAQILWRPNSWFSVLGNQYFLGADTLGNPGRTRYHTDDSIEIKYYDHPERNLDKMAFSLTGDLGCEQGGGVNCFGDRASGPKQSFIGYMLYNRFWFLNDKYGLTIGGGQINNPGRYLVLLPPINGADAASGTPYFTENPGDPFKAWDLSETVDYMPKQYITFRFEFDHRAANVPYFSGPGGITPPGGNAGALGSLVCNDGTPEPAGGCGSVGIWKPDLRKIENRFDMAILVKF